MARHFLHGESGLHLDAALSQLFGPCCQHLVHDGGGVHCLDGILPTPQARHLQDIFHALDEILAVAAHPCQPAYCALVEHPLRPVFGEQQRGQLLHAFAWTLQIVSQCLGQMFEVL